VDVKNASPFPRLASYVFWSNTFGGSLRPGNRERDLHGIARRQHREVDLAPEDRDLLGRVERLESRPKRCCTRSVAPSTWVPASVTNLRSRYEPGIVRSSSRVDRGGTGSGRRPP